MAIINKFVDILLMEKNLREFIELARNKDEYMLLKLRAEELLNEAIIY